jgi:hypothetical protein
METLKKECTMIKALALLMVFAGAVGFITGLLGVFGPDVVSVSPWLLTILGLIFFLSGYGLFRKDLDEFEQ